MRVIIERGDITKVKVDAVVNAANPYLRGGGGVDGAIHRAAGPELLAACQALPVVGSEPGVPIRCPVGESRITPGFNLAKFVIHAVGPVYKNWNRSDATKLLALAHARSLGLAVKNGCRTVAFPALSCGLYGYPPEEAAEIAGLVLTRATWNLDEVRFVMFTDECYRAFGRELGVRPPR